MGLREQIFSKQDRELRAVDVPEWGCTVYVRGMSVAERKQFFEISKKLKEDESNVLEMTARVVVMTCCDPEGNLLFSNADLPMLLDRSAKALDTITKEALDLNGMGADSVDEAKKN